jgi:hypothetical protein
MEGDSKLKLKEANNCIVMLYYLSSCSYFNNHAIIRKDFLNVFAYYGRLKHK